MLYEINQTIMDLMSTMESVAQEEIPEVEKQEKIEQLILAYNKQIQDLEKESLEVAKAVKNEIAFADMIQTEIRSLQERKKRHQNKAEYLKRLLSNILSPEDKFEDSQARISWRKSKAVWYDVEHIEDLPVTALKMELKVSKSDLKKWLTENGNIDIARIEEKQNLQIK